MRVLFATGSRAHPLTIPLLGDEQVSCGPALPNIQIGDHVCSVNTPLGEYDLAGIASRLSSTQKPDVVVVDASVRSMPRNMQGLCCPKVLIVGDTHCQRGALSRTLQYATSERFDRVILISNRHHLDFFRDAGVEPFWLPGLTFPFRDADVQAARCKERDSKILYTGPFEAQNLRVSRSLSAIARAHLPLSIDSGPHVNALRANGAAAIGLNISFNGEWNANTFEIVAAGGLLVTDRLTSGAGMQSVWNDSCVVYYSGETELVQRAQHYLDHPDEARVIALAGQEWFDRNFNEARRCALFRDIVFNARSAPEFEIRGPKKRFALSAPVALALASGCDAILSLNSSSKQVRVGIGGRVPEVVSTALTRISSDSIQIDGSNSPSDVVIVSRFDALTHAVSPSVQGVWCWYGDDASVVLPELEAELRKRGFVRSNENYAWFDRARPSVRESDTNLRTLLEQGQYDAALRLAQTTLNKDKRSLEAHLVLADLALETGDRDLFARFDIQCRARTSEDIRLLNLEVRASSAAPKRMMARMGYACIGFLERGALQDALDIALTAAGTGRPEGFRWLAQCYLAAGRYENATDALSRCSEQSRSDAYLWLQAGMLAFGAGKMADALAAILQADAMAESVPEIELALGVVASAVGLPKLAMEALRSAERDVRCCDCARRQLAEIPVPTAEVEERDLIICHGEITKLHGTGVLIRRFFQGQNDFITVRSRTLYGGEVEFPGDHFVFRGSGLSERQRSRQLRRLLGSFKVRRILCIPFAPEDFANALAVSACSEAPLCTYVMDDQLVYGAVSPILANAVFRRSRLRLAISPEMREIYESRFECTFTVMPPLIQSTEQRVENHWSPGNPGKQVVLVGNVWSETQFERLRVLIKTSGLKLDWYGNKNVPYLQGRITELEQDGIYCHGFVPEAELASRLAEYACVLVPSGILDGTEKDEWLTRLSLPSRMVFILCQSFTPMLVLGHPATCAARFVERFRIGFCSSFDPDEASKVLCEMLEPRVHSELVNNARKAAPAFVMPDAGDWIWRSLKCGDPQEAPFMESFEGILRGKGLHASIEVTPIALAL
jgi:hypothetical protein